MEETGSTVFDAIVVGTGPGGGTVARELNRRGSRVLILERGPGTPLKGSVPQFLSQAMVPGRSLHFTPQLLALAHGLTLGGSSAFYYATAFEPPFAMFDSHGIDLRPEVEEVKKELPIAPLRDDLIGPAARRITESARGRSVPGRGARCRSAWAASFVHRGSMTTNLAPALRARWMGGIRWIPETSGFTPQATISSALS